MEPLLPYICKLVFDPNMDVREVAAETVELVYSFIGEEMMVYVEEDLMTKAKTTKGRISASQIASLVQRLEQVRVKGGGRGGGG